MTNSVYKLTQDLKRDQKHLFTYRYDKEKKTMGKAILFCLIFGGVGGQKYYLEQYGIGILCTLFFFTGIPTIMALIELAFFLRKEVDAFNHRLAEQIILTV